MLGGEVGFWSPRRPKTYAPHPESCLQGAVAVPARAASRSHPWGARSPRASTDLVVRTIFPFLNLPITAALEPTRTCPQRSCPLRLPRRRGARVPELIELQGVNPDGGARSSCLSRDGDVVLRDIQAEPGGGRHPRRGHRAPPPSVQSCIAVDHPRPVRAHGLLYAR